MLTQVSGQKGNKTMACLWITLAAGAALCAWNIRSGFQDVVEGYFFGALLIISVALGGLGIRLIHTLTGGRWAEPVRKYFLCASRTFPAALILSIPVLFWLSRIYPWTAAHYGLRNAGYLNVPFFMVRCAIYFAVWMGSAWWLDKHNKRVNVSGLLGVLFALTGTFAAMDWIMSLRPTWYSTIFGIAFVVGQVLYSFCFIIMLNGFFKQPGSTISKDGDSRFIDIGNIILTMLILWAYMSFSQFLLIWMANKPDEISWYLGLTQNGWRAMPLFVIIVNFFVPFFLLLNRSLKSSPTFLAILAAGIMLTRIVEMGWLVFANLSLGTGRLSPVHAGAAVAVVSLYMLVLLNRTRAYEREDVP
ncbi:MAG: hypothetical protein ABSH12_01685 [Endomicrobiales bacterium]|jgi:hypothetical protein